MSRQASLRWYYPDQVGGCDLSPAMRGTPERVKVMIFEGLVNSHYANRLRAYIPKEVPFL